MRLSPQGALREPRGCLPGPGVNIMTGLVTVMDDGDTALLLMPADVDTELCLLVNGLY